MRISCSLPTTVASRIGRKDAFEHACMPLHPAASKSKSRGGRESSGEALSRDGTRAKALKTRIKSRVLRSLLAPKPLKNGQRQDEITKMEDTLYGCSIFSTWSIPTFFRSCEVYELSGVLVD